MRRILLPLVALAAVGPLPAGGDTEDAQDRTMNTPIENPVLRGFRPDPSIVRAGDDYYIATSTFEWFPGVAIHQSRDLAHWRLLAYALTRTSQLDMLGNPPSGGVWAPCLSHCDGVFHLVYTNVRHCRGGFNDAHNYLVTAPAVTGPWSEPIYLNSSGFDPSLFHDSDGRKWLLNMIWNHRPGDKSGGIVLQEYDPAQRRLIGTPKLIFEGTEFGGTEAPHVYKHGGYYHLMTAEGGTGYGHVVTMARARRIDGPYEPDPGNPILTARDDPSLPLQKAGHASLVAAQDGSLFLAYLCGRPLPGTRHCNLGRETALQRCAWNADGWLRLAGGGNTPAVRVEPPDLPAHPFPPEPVRDEFDQPRLSAHYNTLRAPADETWLSLTERPGWLRLRGRESMMSRFRQSLIARRLTAFQCQVTARLEFQPESFQQMAGLICRYNEENYVYLRLSHDEKLGVNLAILSADRGKGSTTEPVAVPPNAACHLRATFDYRDLRFAWSLDGKDWTPIGPTFDAGKLSDDYCHGFTGTFVGLAVQDLSGRGKHADFDFFEYHERGAEDR